MGKKHKIALFIPSLHGGGAERVMANLANGLVARGYDVDLILIKAEGPYLEQLSDRVKIIDLNLSRLRYCLPRLMRYLKNEKPDAMISSMGGANFFSILARRFLSLSFPLTVRVETAESLAIQHKNNWLNRCVFKANSYLYSLPDYVVAVSKGVGVDLLNNYQLEKEKVCIIYNPIVNKSIFLLMKEEVSLPLFLANEDIPLIISAGRLETVKDYPTLIRAFKLLRERQDVRLLILGEGAERENLEKLIESLELQDNVWLAGFVSNPFAYMKKASLFVLSSIFEGFGNVIVEAMACGVPVVSTNCPSGPSEILENGKWGELVPVGDPAALAEAMAKSLNSKEKPDVRKRAMDFTVDKAVEEHLNILFGAEYNG
jgi:glycosyltransferase involved in cell wall biosynthesis